MKKSAFKSSACIVTFDLKGLIKNGGIGTASAAMAEELVSHGFAVDILYANTIQTEDVFFPFWQAHYLEKGIRLVSVREPVIGLEGLFHVRMSYAVYLHLKGSSYDYLHFPDMFGLGYHVTLAKRLGIDFQKSTVCVTLHGPTHWQHEFNRVFPFYPDELQRYYLERKSVENADVVLGSTDFIFDWIKEKGWRPKGETVKLPLPVSLPANLAYRGNNRHFDEIVFFGRLETRKGLEIFCEALTSLQSELKEVKVRFLGKPNHVTGRPAMSYIGEISKKWLTPFEVIEDLDQEGALEYLCSKNVLVVIPSLSETLGYTVLECLNLGVPFLCTDIPAFREIVPTSIQDTVFFEPTKDSLVEAIRDRLATNHYKPSKNTPLKRKSTWANWHRHRRVFPAEELNFISNGPMITVCMAHRNRPHYLEEAIKSIDNQSYQNIELIVVDDASDTLASKLYLKEVAKRPNTKVLINERQSGPGVSRNRAAFEARGDYILIMDDDNIAKATELETLISAAIRENADIVTCPFERFHGDGQGAHICSDSIWLPYGDDMMMSTMFNTLGDMNSLIKTSVFRELGGLVIKRKPGAEDFNFFCRAVTKGYKLLVYPEPLFWYRTHNTNHSYSTGFAESLQISADAYSELCPYQDMSPLMGMMKAWQMHLYPGGKNAFQVGSLLGGSRDDLFKNEQILKAVSTSGPDLLRTVRIKKVKRQDWILIEPRKEKEIIVPLRTSSKDMKYVFDHGSYGRFKLSIVEHFSNSKKVVHEMPAFEGRTSSTVIVKGSNKPRKVCLHISAGTGFYGVRKVYYVTASNSKSTHPKTPLRDREMH